MMPFKTSGHIQLYVAGSGLEAMFDIRIGTGMAERVNDGFIIPFFSERLGYATVDAFPL